MKKLFLITIIIVGISFAVVAFKFRSGDAPSEENQQNQQQKEEQAQAEPDQPKKLVVSDNELARLKLQGVVSADDKYYIKSGTPFPKIVSLETGTEYSLKQSANYTKITKISWTSDGKTLVYIYQVSDPDYLNLDILNTVSISDVVDQKFPNAARVLIAAAKLDYAWLDGRNIWVYELQNFDAERKFYHNGNLTVYNAQTNMFEYPMKGEIIENVYSITLSAANRKFLYSRAKLDADGKTIGQEYVVANFDGSVVVVADTYPTNWNK